MAAIRCFDPATGKLACSWVPSEPTIEMLHELRERMWRPDAGTWWWASVSVGTEGQVEADFHHEGEPWLEEDGLSLMVEPSAYRADLESLPREGALPGWLEQRLSEED